MKYELQKLDEIISNLIRPGNFIKQQNKSANLKKWVAVVLSEKGRISNQFMQEIFNCENEKRIGSYIQQHQHYLIKLSDTIYGYLVPGTVDSLHGYDQLKAFVVDYTEIQESIESMVLYVRLNFKKYYGLHFKITDKLLDEVTPGIKMIFRKTRTILKKHGVEERLIRIACYPFEKCLVTIKGISHARLKYINYYKKEMDIFLAKTEITTEDTINFLLQVNFNRPEFVKYYVRKLSAFTDDNADIATQSEFYSLQLKSVNQLQQFAGLAYECNLPGIREQVGAWLTEEIYFLEKKQQLYNNTVNTSCEPANSLNKVHTKLSVAHLSLAVKLLLDTGVIKNKNASELIRMVARNFRTENSEHISEDSLRNKGYNIESGAVKGMKEVIVGLLNEVRKY